MNTLAFDNGRGPKTIIPLADILSGVYAPTIDANNRWTADPAVGKFLEFRVKPYSGTDLSMNPADYEPGKRKMIPLVRFTDAELAAAKHRTFVFGRSSGADGKPWTVETDGGPGLNATLGLVSAAPETMGDPDHGIAPSIEIWHIRNGGGGWAHPVHVHFEEGQYLLRGDPNPVPGQPDLMHHPPIWERFARKDMYRISNLGMDLGIPDSSMYIDVVIRFREFAGTFVEHCHNTQHEDTAMLLRWDNEHPGQLVRLQTPIPDWDGVSYIPTNSLPTAKSGDTRPATLAFVAPKQLAGDINRDTVVNGTDLGILFSEFFLAGPWAGDLNEDEIVNGTDLGILFSQFFQGTGYPLGPLDPLP